jgi:import receptor subunit TOM70
MDQVTLAQDFSELLCSHSGHRLPHTTPLSAFPSPAPFLNTACNNTFTTPSPNMAPTNQAPLPNSPGPFPVEIPVEQGTSSLWDRLSSWAAENKGVVYTIAGVTLVVGAGGAIYYLSSDSRQDASTTASNKRKKQRDRKRAKERSEKTTAADEAPSTEAKKASVAPAAEDELPEVDESSVAALSDEVRHSHRNSERPG